MLYFIDSERSSREKFRTSIREHLDESTIRFFANCSEALHELNEARKYNFPQLIMCSDNMPDLEGWEFLRKLRGESNRNFTPVIIFARAGSLCRLTEAYEYGANSYLILPEQEDKYRKMVDCVFSYWIETVLTP